MTSETAYSDMEQIFIKLLKNAFDIDHYTSDLGNDIFVGPKPEREIWRLHAGELRKCLELSAESATTSFGKKVDPIEEVTKP